MVSIVPSMESPVPLSEIESVLAWVDTFKLSRPTRKINRDFSDAVPLAEMLSVHYPKLVEMHNYPPRNSHALKLNNWMTLNRKVLKKLKLNLCCNTMEQLANSTPGIIERVLLMVREKVRRDEEANKTTDGDQNMSSGGSYYEACGDDDHVLIVPVKTRVNGVLETIQQKVINHDLYLALKEELKDAKDTTEVLKQKVEHLDNLLKLKEERIDELQKQLERKATRRKEVEAYCTFTIPNETAVLPFSKVSDNTLSINKIPPSKSIESNAKVAKLVEEPSKIPVPKIIEVAQKTVTSGVEIPYSKQDSKSYIPKIIEDASKLSTMQIIEYTNKAPASNTELYAVKDKEPKPSITEALGFGDNIRPDIDRVKSDVFQEAEVEEKYAVDVEEFKDSEQGVTVTIADSIENEIKDITDAIERLENKNY